MRDESKLWKTNENPKFTVRGKTNVVSHFKGITAIVANDFVRFKVFLMFFPQSSYVTLFCKLIVFGLCYQKS